MRLRQSNAIKGEKNGMYGKHHSNETKKKISEANTNPSEETRRKIRITKVGISLNMEHRRKISIALKGLKKSDETRKRMSLAQKGRIFSQETRDKMRESGKRKIFSKEHCKKISNANRGERNSHWRGGITPLYKSIRENAMYASWRDSVYVRDGYKCIKCGDKQGGNLLAHHIKLFSTIIKEENIKKLDDISPKSQLWDIKNGITVCISCHKKLHKHLKLVKNLKNSKKQSKIGTVVDLIYHG